jgi:elongation factor Ts
MSVDDIKKLREITSLGVNDCKNALKEAAGDFDKALNILQGRGVRLMEKKQHRVTSQGRIDAYVHFGGNLAAMVEVNCETDFVARTDRFKSFVKDIAMQVAAASPFYVKREDIPEDLLKDIEDVEGYVKEKCLLEQVFIKDGKMTVRQYLQEVISQTGENVVIKRFTRFGLGE